MFFVGKVQLSVGKFQLSIRSVFYSRQYNLPLSGSYHYYAAILIGHSLVAWHNGNALSQINEVTL